MLSILATFFICIQQRELSIVGDAPALRAWLSNGIRYTNSNDEAVFQSSLAALTLLESPYEYLGIAVTNFIVGMAAFMVGSWRDRAKLHAGDATLKETAVLIYFAVGTGFAMCMFPVLLGSKDQESRAVGHVLPGFDAPSGKMMREALEQADYVCEKPQSLP